MLKLIALIITLSAAATFAVPIAINGTITNAAGVPVAGVSVTLLRQKITVTTDASGYYSFTGEAGVLQGVVGSGAYHAPSLANNRLFFNITRNEIPVRIDLLDIKGRIISNILTGRLAQGNYAVAVTSPVSASQYTITRAIIDGKPYIFKNLSINDRPESFFLQPSPANLSKTASFADTLLAVKEGYLDTRLFIANYTGTQNISLRTGFTVMFAINRNARYAYARPCSLLIRQSTSRIARIRLTQQFTSIADRVTPVWPRMNINDTVFRQIPLFDSADAENSATAVLLSGENELLVPWILRKGNGPISVFAEITWLDSVSHPLDTISDFIDIGRDSINITLWDLPNAGVDTMKRIANFSRLQSDYVLHHPQVNFKFNVFDTTCKPEFEYWLMFADSGAAFYSQSGTEPQRLEPRHCTTTAITGGIITYRLDTATTEGIANLTQLTKTIYDYRYDIYITSGTVTGSPGYLYRRLMNRANTLQPFAVVCRFRGKQFDDERLSFLMSYGDPFSFFDFDPPIYYSASMQNGDTVRNPFEMSYESLHDEGHEIITSISLIIAEKPPTFIWNYQTWSTYTKWTPAITLDELMLQPHEIIPIQLPISSITNNVTTPLIDPRNWKSGEYLVGLIVKSEFRQETLALAGGLSNGMRSTNPFLITAITGH